MTAGGSAPGSLERSAAEAGPDVEAGRLGDFSMQAETLLLLPLAVAIGALATAIAIVLLDLIGLFTNALYYGRLDVRLVSPAANALGIAAVAIPVVGGLVIGVMARYGSERIRGHGIPEAMETILVGGSRVEPRLAILKPISSAISIGSGGPFGAEGPIILTGGAFGSLIGQLFHLTAAERKTLLVAGAAAGMTAVFGTPVAAVLLGVELLLFEWKPRSLIPVAAASLVAALLRSDLAAGGFIAAAPLFPLPAGAPVALDNSTFLGALGLGLVGGLVAWAATVAVYVAEDGFGRLSIPWMWWPAIGGFVVGIGGLIEPRALGVGYDTIRAELSGSLAVQALVVLAVVKLVIWALALGSGTSGGILAPLLLLGGAVGGIAGSVLPAELQPYAALLGMAATLAGATRSPFTGVVFAVELTGSIAVLPLLLLGCVAADLVSVLVLRRSILTEKVARRGFHVSREYAVDPLEALFARDVMATHVLVLRTDQRLSELGVSLADGAHRRQRLFPVVDGADRLVGVVGRVELSEAVGLALRREASQRESGDWTSVAGVMRPPVVAFEDETLRHVADRMVGARVGVMPVVERRDRSRLRGLVAQADLLRARDRLLVEERHRERILRARLVPALRSAIRRTRTAGRRASS